MEQCVEHYATFPIQRGLTYCNATYDSFLCWPPTEAGSTAFQNCPAARLSDTSRLAFRRCGLDGLWLGRRKNESNLIGWTNYTPCFPAEVQNLFEKVYDDEADPQALLRIAKNTRNMEIVGFTFSVVALAISLYFFIRFRALQNTRTRIHRHLFMSLAQEVLLRLGLYMEQVATRDSNDDNSPRGLDSIPYLCEAIYILLEYSTSAMFCWMLIEGLYLHNIVTDNALRETTPFRTYMVIGWGVPFIITAIWAGATAYRYRYSTVPQCWYGYNFRKEYWICQGPRLAIIIVNFGFLLNILRVLIGKLNQSADSEMMKIKKTVRAALVLLPLLGITNILNMIEPPLDGPVWKFAMWSYTTHFLRSFQGYFIAHIYCFINAEVRQVVAKTYADWVGLRADARRMQRARNTNRSRRRRRSSSIRRPFEWIQGAFNTQCNDDNIEVDTESVRRMYSDPDVLDNLPTIRFDAETNVSNIA